MKLFLSLGSNSVILLPGDLGYQWTYRSSSSSTPFNGKTDNSGVNIGPNEEAPSTWPTGLDYYPEGGSEATGNTINGVSSTGPTDNVYFPFGTGGTASATYDVTSRPTNGGSSSRPTNYPYFPVGTVGTRATARPTSGVYFPIESGATPRPTVVTASYNLSDEELTTYYPIGASTNRDNAGVGVGTAATTQGNRVVGISESGNY